MHPPAQFCQHCGKPLNAQARFCGRCGQPVPPLAPPQAVVSPPPPAPQPDTPPPVSSQVPPAEPILGAIPGATYGTGFLGMRKQNFTIVVTAQRLIFARQTDAMMRENVQRARQQAKQGGAGFFGRLGAQLGANSGEHYLAMPAQQILAEHPENWFLFNNQVNTARLKQNAFDDDEAVTYALELKAGSGKYHFDFQSLNMRHARQILKQALGKALR